MTIRTEHAAPFFVRETPVWVADAVDGQGSHELVAADAGEGFPAANWRPLGPGPEAMPLSVS